MRKFSLGFFFAFIALGMASCGALAQALEKSKITIAVGGKNLFYYLPLTRCESTAIQDEAVAAFRRLPEESSDTCRPVLLAALQQAMDQAHIIQRFGRFPQRNALLGRRSTGAEQQWLREQGPLSPT